jgi:peptide/nickel transport system ATP-binding protein
VNQVVNQSPVLEAEGLGKDFRLSRGPRGKVLSAVRDVSLQLQRGKVLALVGESGSGKSTVARLLAGQERPTRGTIRLGDAPASLRGSGNHRAYKSKVQMIFQDPFASLNPVHTVGYHLERPIRLHGQKNTGQDLAEHMRSLLGQVRLAPAEHFLPKYPHELSGGQRQRVAIARAMAVNPEILLADEPVSMLDVSIRLEILTLLDTLRDRFNLAVLYITHDIASARYFAEEILVMYAGQIVERGPAEAVTQRPAHPYTQLLVASAPDPDAMGEPGQPAATATGKRTSAAPLPSSGCRFSPRCPFADARCQQESPPLIPVAPGRSAACWRLDVTAPSEPGSPGRTPTPPHA